MSWASGSAPGLDELAAALRSWREGIVSSWVDDARMHAGHWNESEQAQRVRELVDKLADALPTLASGVAMASTSAMAETFAASRIADAMDVAQTVGQLAQLRTEVVKRWWDERALVGGALELLALERAIDELIREVLQAHLRLQQQAVQRQESLLQRVIAASPVGIAILDGSELTVKMANPAYEALIMAIGNTQRVSLIGRRPHELATKAPDAAFWSQKWREVADTGQPEVIPEYNVTMPGRGETTWSVAVEPLPAAGGPSDVLVVVAEVTSQARERRRLDNERRRMEVILHTLPVGVIIADAEGRILDANENARRVWGGTAPIVDSIDEYVQFRGWRVQDGAQIQPHEWPLARALRNGESSAGEAIDIQRFDGSCGTMLNTAAPMRDSDGRITGAITVMLDITEQRRLAVQLERQTAEMNAVFDSIADAMIVFDANGEILRMNPRAEALFPFSREELDRELASGKPFAWLSRPDGALIPQHELPIRRALSGEEVRGELMCVASGSGTKIWLSASAAPIRTNKGAPVGAVLTLLDVTHLQETRRQLEDLVRMVSHDLRTPLSSIVLHAELLKRESSAQPSVQRRAQAVATSAERMNVMIQDLVELSRLETRQLKLDLRLVDLGPFVRELVDRLSGTFPTHRLRVAVASGIPAIEADPSRLERIITNLLSNAFKYSAPDKDVLLSVEQREAQVAISVTDFGEGIPPQDLPHLFDRYFRSRRAKRGNVEGLGLGLYISRLLAEAQRASITVSSELGKGSTFTVRFPIP